MKTDRYHLIDTLRGFALINMFVYHTLWSMANIFYYKISWFPSFYTYIWQQSGASLFIILSGFCWALTRKHLKRSLTVLGCAVFIFIFTFLFSPGSTIIFGIIAFIGTAMLLMMPLAKILKHLPPTGGLILSLILFFALKHVPHGYCGIGSLHWQLPQNLYNGYFTAFIGMPPDNFYSADYFPLIPWLFMYTAGYFAYYLLMPLLSKTNMLNYNISPLTFLGKNSLLTYLLHQPIIYCLLLLWHSNLKPIFN